jgi:Na+-translocating ferredoxin:NAD+ oxidoreductase subunit B
VTGSLADRLDAELPQTQCTRCGYPGCRPYAEALASGEATADRCPPGGTPVARALAAVLRVEERPIDPACGEEGPPRVAVIDEAACIGCAKCLPACPVDAIVGARKMMHTVIAAECSGCELCLPPCPVDCITLVETAPAPLAEHEIRSRAAHYRVRHENHVAREQRRETQRRATLAARSPGTLPR